MESARRWNGFVCPDCRFVFRVPRDHDGQGIVCPSCRRMLRIPGEGDAPPPLMAPLRQATAAAGPAAETGEEARSVPVRRRGKSRRKGSDPEVPAWETEPARIRHGEFRAMRWFLLGGIPLFVIAVSAVIFFLRSPEPLAVPPPPMAAVSGGNPGEPAAEPEIVLPDVMKRSEASVLAEAEPLARAFLEATSVEEVLPLVHHPEEVEPRLRRHYPDGTIEPVGLSTFNTTGSLNYRGTLVSMSVTTRDHEQRQIAFVDSPDGLKIDWESWIGWSDMTWEDFIAKRPTEPQVFRVILRLVDYYNFAFTDETEWQSYSLTSPDGEHVLYGYVEKGSVLSERLHPGDQKARVAMMLALKHPEDPSARRQVLIDSLVSEGWVEGTAGTP